MQSEASKEAIPSQIRSLVEKQHSAAQLIFPDVTLSLQAFAQKVATVLEKHFAGRPNESKLDPATSQFLGGLKWEELFLTTACATGDGAAWKFFHSRYQGVIQKAARNCSENSSEAQELSDSLISDLFLPIFTASGKRTNKIGQYDGLGSLEGWIKVVVSRMAIDQIRRSQKQVSLEDLETEPAAPREEGRGGQTNHGIDLPKASQMFLAGLDYAMNQLDAQDKLILSLYYLKDLNLKEIGRMLRVHESTVSRTLDRLKKQVRKSVERHLRNRFQVRASEVPQLVEMAYLEADVDLKKMLAK